MPLDPKNLAVPHPLGAEQLECFSCKPLHFLQMGEEVHGSPSYLHSSCSVQGNPGVLRTEETSFSEYPHPPRPSERLRKTHPTHSSDEVQQMPYTLETQEAKSRATTASWQRRPLQVLQAPSEPKTKFTG